MQPDDVLIELMTDAPGLTGHSSDVEEMWHVIQGTQRRERVYPYVEALRLARELAMASQVDVYRRRYPADAPELAESYRPRAAGPRHA